MLNHRSLILATQRPSAIPDERDTTGNRAPQKIRPRRVQTTATATATASIPIQTTAPQTIITINHEIDTTGNRAPQKIRAPRRIQPTAPMQIQPTTLQTITPIPKPPPIS